MIGRVWRWYWHFGGPESPLGPVRAGVIFGIPFDVVAFLITFLVPG